MAARARALPHRCGAQQPRRRHSTRAQPLGAPARRQPTRCAASITVIGLGPGDARLLTREAHALLTGAPGHVYVRTGTHPTLAALPGLRLRAFDDVYEGEATLQDVYPRIADALLAAAAGGEDVLYAVPGDPCVAEMTVRLLRERAPAAGVTLRVASALSFVEPLLAALGVDALPALWLGDALDVAAAASPPFSAAAPALLSQVYSRAVASELKLTLMNAYPETHAVALVHGAGDAGDAAAGVEWGPLHAIDFSDRIAARTSLYVPPWAPPAPGAPPASFESVLDGVAAARDALEGPWREGDPEHAGVAAGLLAAAERARDAADAGDAAALQAALADVLAAVAVHACVAADEGEFAARDVLGAAASVARGMAPGGDAAAQPRAPQGRGYTLEEADEEAEDE